MSRQQQRRQYDSERDATAKRRLYDAVWRAASQAWLLVSPLCRYCEIDGHTTAATLVDHFWPHRGDRALFWRREFWVSSCDACHSGMKQRAERAGASVLLALAERLGLGRP